MKACINIDHIECSRWEPPLVDADCYAVCQAIFPGLEGEHYREMSKASGAKNKVIVKKQEPLKNECGKGQERGFL